MKYNEEMAIKSLSKLCSSISIRDINLGELEKTDGKYDLVVVGNQLFANEIGRTLRKIRSDDIVIRTKYLESKFSVSMKGIIDTYGGQEKAELAAFVQNINKNKAVAVMFRDRIEVVLSRECKFGNGRVKYSEVVINDCGKIELRIVIKEDTGKTIEHIPAEQYGKSFRLNSSVVNTTIKENSWAREIIKLNNAGLIDTIEIRGGGKIIGIDNQFCICNGNVIGEWDNDGRMQFNDEAGDEQDIVGKIERMVSIHRRYIIPYGLCKPNIVEVK